MVATLLGTFGPPLCPRHGGALSCIAWEMEVDVQVLRLPVRWWRGPCLVVGLRMAGLVMLLDFVGGRCRVWRKKKSPGKFPTRMPQR